MGAAKIVNSEFAVDRVDSELENYLSPIAAQAHPPG